MTWLFCGVNFNFSSFWGRVRYKYRWYGNLRQFSELGRMNRNRNRENGIQNGKEAKRTSKMKRPARLARSYRMYVLVLPTSRVACRRRPTTGRQKGRLRARTDSKYTKRVKAHGVGTYYIGNPDVSELGRREMQACSACPLIKMFGRAVGARILIGGHCNNKPINCLKSWEGPEKSLKFWERE
jgi:hypothetical protein